jgi:hypothetical protein
MTVLFADRLPEIFEALPEKTKRRAALAIDLIAVFPQMYPTRNRGLMRGYAISLQNASCFTIE